MSKIDASREHSDPQENIFSCPLTLDRHRILHSTAFRRLGYKTQVFCPFEADHFRTRLTHSIEVAHIARLLAQKFDANQELAETISLAHDLGHGPFGHNCETTLNRLMAGFGGFEHNHQSLRVVQYLEHPYPWFTGLNLTRATIVGLETHETPYDNPSLKGQKVSSEAQIASWADRIAYDSSDLEDAFGAKFVRHEDMIKLELYREAWETLSAEIRTKPLPKIRRVICESLQRIMIESISLKDNLFVMDKEKLKTVEEFEKFLLDNVYLSRELRDISKTVDKVISRLFDKYSESPELLPERFSQREKDEPRERIITDYIAGMTDRFCLNVYQTIFGAHPDINPFKAQFT